MTALQHAIDRYAATNGVAAANLLMLWALCKARDPFIMDWLMALQRVSGGSARIGPGLAEEIMAALERRLERMI